MTIGKRIARLRRESSFSQEYLAEKLDVSRQAVSKWENDLTSPDTNNLIALSQLFDVSVEYLATGKQPQAQIIIKREPLNTAILANTAMLLFLSPLLIQLIGVLTGLFDEMVTVPAGGIEIGIWICYGDSMGAIILTALEIMLLVSAVILTIIYCVLARKKK